ncbi:MAG: tyrosine-type recombinase/integrase [Pseudomonadota bacterium]
MAQLVASYLASPEFADRKESTQRDYRRYCDFIIEKAGDVSVKSFKRSNVMAARDAKRDTPGAANALVRVFSILFEHAIDKDWRTDNPAKGVGSLKLGEGKLPWPQWAINDYRKHATGPALTVFELCLGTGQRIGDVLKMRWGDIEEDGINVKQQKTGAELWVPMTADLLAYLDALPRDALTILATPQGRPYIYHLIERLTRQPRKDSCTTAYSLHGLRKTRAIQLAEEGRSDAQIQAITGHATQAMVAHYRKGADQKRLAKGEK